jgi:hypothetical protein
MATLRVQTGLSTRGDPAVGRANDLSLCFQGPLNVQHEWGRRSLRWRFAPCVTAGAERYATIPLLLLPILGRLIRPEHRARLRACAYNLMLPVLLDEDDETKHRVVSPKLG